MVTGSRTVALLVAFLATLVVAVPSAGAAASRTATVDYVHDGDTIRLMNGHYVRLIGIDTPEIPPAGHDCGGELAAHALKRRLRHGDRVRLVRDPRVDNRDYYGRRLRYVERNGVDLGARMVALGWAKVYVFERPAFSRVHRYRAAQRRGRIHDRGAWRRCRHF
jgi:endonuclease YncB( thermonuclease family)